MRKKKKLDAVDELVGKVCKAYRESGCSIIQTCNRTLLPESCVRRIVKDLRLWYRYNEDPLIRKMWKIYKPSDILMKDMRGILISPVI